MDLFKKLATYYLLWLSRLGLVKFSVVFAVIIILIALVIQLSVTFALTGFVSSVDFVRSIFFGLILTPWAVFFMSMTIEEIEESRKRLSAMIEKLGRMHVRDQVLTARLQANISKLNSEMEERERAEAERGRAIEHLEAEVKQRESAQAELEEGSALLRSFIDSSPDLVFYRNEFGQFVGCNRAFEQISGFSQAQLIGLSLHDVYPTELADKILKSDQEVLERDEPVSYEQWLEYPDGKKAHFEMRKVPFYDSKGKRLGLLGYGRDITERMRQQAELEKANRDNNQFISTLSHELRTPLNGVVGLSRILLDTPLNPEQRQHLNTILLSATTLGHIFNDIIDLDKLDRRRFAIDNSPMDFGALLNDVETLTHLQAQAKGLHFEMLREESLPNLIKSDATRLRQVLWNLCNNAVKFTERGSVTVRVSAQPMPSVQRTQLRFDIQDTGIGIAKDEQEQIFAMYYQASNTQKAVGTGIGLAISQRLVEAMGGDITLSSELGKGACFSVLLEVELASSVNNEVSVEHPPLEILLVEDVELNVTIARALLERLGHNVSVAMTGSAALNDFNPDDFDLYLLDIQLPDMTGFDIARTLNKRYPASTIPPLVALTANVVKDRQSFIDAGMLDIVTKPINHNALIACLNGVFNVSSKEEEAIAQNDAPSAVNAELSRSGKPVLDHALISEYCDNIGIEILQESVAIFERVIPDYLAVLESNLFARDEQGIASEAHKIKGAAGSVGLARLQRLANKIQSPELPAWWDNVDDWVHQLAHDLPRDVQLLKQVLAQYAKESSTKI